MRLKKSLGQHLLVDRKYLRQIVDSLALNRDEVVVEIGAGTGNLTELIAQKAKRVIAIEKDEELAEKLKDKNLDKVEVITGDVLDFRPDEYVEKAVAAGNLPYYLSSRIMRWFLDWREVFYRGGFLLQEEVARRFSASSGREVTPLSFLLQNYYEVSMEFTVPAGAFQPPPRVRSAFILLKRRRSPLFVLESLKEFESFLRLCFSSRRKTLFNNLRKQYSEEVLKGIDRGARPEELVLRDFVEVYGIIKKNAEKKS